MRVLVVEDYSPLRRSLSRGLREEGYAVDSVAEGEDAISCVETGAYDIVILDVMLPGRDGFSILKHVRDRQISTQVLLLTAKDQLADRIRGLDLGADDYLVKPFAFEELAARLRALLRRSYRHPSPAIKVGDLELNPVARTVKRAGRIIELTAREYAILEALAYRCGEIVTRDEIWDRIYDFSEEPGSNVIDVYVGYLRKKLEAGGGTRLVHTRRGIGYVLAESPE